MVACKLLESASWCNSSYARPSVGTFISVLDAAKLAAFLVNGDESVLSNAMREQMLEGQLEDFIPGLQNGFGVGQVADGLFIADQIYPYPFKSWHSRYSVCSQSQMMTIVPSRKFAVVTLANVRNFQWFTKTQLLAAKTLLDLPDVEAEAFTPDDTAAKFELVGEYESVGAAEHYQVTAVPNGLHLSGNGMDEQLVPIGPAWYLSSRGWVSFYFDPAHEKVEYMRLDMGWVARRYEAVDGGDAATP